VGDKQEDRVFRTSAANVAAVKNLYTLVATKDDPDMVDRIWSDYEANLHKTIELLIAGKADAETWIRTSENAP
jgi:hypothetical protein